MKKFKLDFEINYKELFKSWYNILKYKLNNSIYYNNLFVFLNESYKQKVIYPEKKDIFKPFQLTNFNDLRIVILGDEPLNNKSTGLAFASDDNIREESFPPSLLNIKDYIENEIYNGFRLPFDPTLNNWTKQGILLLNTSLTKEGYKKGSHNKYWNKFIQDIISIINENKTGIIFCLMNEDNLKFKEFINENVHYIIKSKYPFKEINNIIEKNNGKEFCIEW